MTSDARSPLSRPIGQLLALLAFAAVMGTTLLGLSQFGIWDPWRILAGGYLFGFVDGFQLRLQALGSTIPSFFLNMLPYLFTVLVVAVSSGEKVQRKLGAPTALGLPYWREERT